MEIGSGCRTKTQQEIYLPHERNSVTTERRRSVILPGSLLGPVDEVELACSGSRGYSNVQSRLKCLSRGGILLRQQLLRPTNPVKKTEMEIFLKAPTVHCRQFPVPGRERRLTLSSHKLRWVGRCWHPRL